MTYTPSSGRKLELRDVVARTPANPYDTHTFTVTAASLGNPPAGGVTIRSVPDGHDLKLTAAQLEAIAAGDAVEQATEPDSTGHSHALTFRLTA